MAVVVKPSCWYPIRICCCVTDGNRGAVWKWQLILKCIWSKGASPNSSMWKKWHPLTFTDACWMFMETKQWMWAQWCSGWDISAMVTVTVGHLCWCRFLQVQHAGSFPLLVKMHRYWWWLCWKIVFCSWEFSLPSSVIVLFLSVVDSMEINRRHYFQSNLQTLSVYYLSSFMMRTGVGQYKHILYNVLLQLVFF